MPSDTTGQVIRHARVSAAGQNLDRQLTALGDVDKLFSEKLSDKDRERPQLTEVIDYAREGYTDSAKRPNPLSRSVIDLLGIMNELMVNGVLVVAEIERATTRERQAEGSPSPRSMGSRTGVPSSPRSKSLRRMSASTSGGRTW